MAGFRQWTHRPAAGGRVVLNRRPRWRGLAERRLSIAAALGAGIAGFSFVAGARADTGQPPAYRITELSALDGRDTGATSINDRGQIVGEASIPGGDHAYLYDGTGLHDLGDLGFPASGATGINNAGQVIGGSNITGNSGYHAFLYDSTGMHDLGTLGGDHVLAGGIDDSRAGGINDAGQIVGASSLVDAPGYHPFLYSNGVMQDLGVPPALGFPVDQNSFIMAHAINASGLVLVGASYWPTEQNRSFLWQNGAWQALTALNTGSASARTLNDAGQIIGTTTAGYADAPPPHAFLYDNSGLRDLGTFGGPASYPTAINNLGQVVGYAQLDAPPPAHPGIYANGIADHPFLYSGGVMYDLTNLLLTSALWERFVPQGINDQGQIVGEGESGDPSSPQHRTGIYLLTPDPTAQVTIPAAPSGLAVKNISNGGLDLSWADSSDNAQSFEIERRLAWTDWTRIGAVLPNTSTYADTTVSAYSHYLYRVRAINGAGASDWSNEAGGDAGIGAVASLGWSAQDFGSTPLGTSSDLRSLTITNRGTGPLSLQSVTLAGSNPGDFSIVDSPASIAAGDTGAIHLLFTPAALGSRSAELILRSNATNPIQPIGLTGSGATPPVPTVALTPSSLSFGPEPVGLSATLAVLLYNSGHAPVKISSIDFQGANAAEFTLPMGSCSGSTLQPGDNCLLNIRFTPTATGPRSATLVITDDAAGGPQLIPLAGTGTEPLLTLSANSLLFAVQPGSATGNAQTLVITNGGDAPLAIEGFTFAGADPNNFQIVSDTGQKSLDPGQSRTLQVSFNAAPTAATAGIAGIPSHTHVTSAAHIAAASYSAILQIQHNDPHPGSPHQITLAAVVSSPPPAAPTGLLAAVVPALNGAPAQVSLTWTNQSTSEKALAIWRQAGYPLGAGSWQRIGVVVPHTTSFADRSVSPGITYTYRVRATTDTLASGWSNLASATLPAVPATPTSLKATAASAGEIDLSWTSGGGNETGVSIFRRAGTRDWQRIAVVSPKLSAYRDRSVQAGTSYAYQIRTHNDHFASAWSNMVSASTPAAP